MQRLSRERSPAAGASSEAGSARNGIRHSSRIDDRLCRGYLEQGGGSLQKSVAPESGVIG